MLTPLTSANPGNGRDRCTATRGWYLNAWVNTRSRPWSWTPTVADARSPARRSARSSKRHTSAHCRQAANTASITACCSAPTCTPLYDRGYLGIDPKHRLLVSPRLRAEFGNGDQFYAKVGEIITLPERRADRPNKDWFLR